MIEKEISDYKDLICETLIDKYQEFSNLFDIN